MVPICMVVMLRPYPRLLGRSASRLPDSVPWNFTSWTHLPQSLWCWDKDADDCRVAEHRRWHGSSDSANADGLEVKVGRKKEDRGLRDVCSGRSVGPPYPLPLIGTADSGEGALQLVPHVQRCWWTWNKALAVSVATHHIDLHTQLILEYRRLRYCFRMLDCSRTCSGPAVCQSSPSAAIVCERLQQIIDSP